MHKSLIVLALFGFAGAACDGGSRMRGAGGGNPGTGSGGNDPGDGNDPGNGPGPGSNPGTSQSPMPAGPDGDYDQDGFSPNQGDCDDTTALRGPNAVEMVGNNVDDDCNGMVDEATSACDASAFGKNDELSLAQAMELCDSRFFLGAMLVGPSDPQARAVVKDFGSFQPKGGDHLALMSTGIAADKNDSSYVAPQWGTDFGNQHANPAPNIVGAQGCGQSTPKTVQDYTELLVRLKVPQNATSFSFNFHFFSAEYPEFVCTMFNDKFLVMMESKHEFPVAENIAFDMQNNPITVNSGFFTICENDTSKPQTQNCKKPVTELAGTGYDEKASAGPVPLPIPGGDKPIGGSTDWLTTTAPVTPGEDVTLRFIIFDEGDGSLDSAVLIDNFRWGAQVVDAPMTIP